MRSENELPKHLQDLGAEDESWPLRPAEEHLAAGRHARRRRTATVVSALAALVLVGGGTALAGTTGGGQGTATVEAAGSTSPKASPSQSAARPTSMGSPSLVPTPGKTTAPPEPTGDLGQRPGWPCPGSPWVTNPTDHLPAGVQLTELTECSIVRTGTVGKSAQMVARTVRVTSGLGALAKALSAADAPKRSDFTGACAAVAYPVPYILVRDTSGREW